MKDRDSPVNVNKYQSAYPRSVRLLNSKAYSYVFEKVEIKVSNRHFLFLARVNNTGHPKLGIIASKKSIKLAVNRNRFKRLVRESFRLTRHSLPPLDIVVLSRNNVSDLDNSELGQQLHESWKRMTRRYNQMQRTITDDG